MKIANAPGEKNETTYIEGIRNGRKTIIDEIYQHFFPKIRHFILNHSGNQEDAKDIFQEALLVVYHKSREQDFQLTCKFDTYLKIICRNIWFKHLRDQNLRLVPMQEEEIVDEQELQEVIARMERYRIYRKHFLMITEKCRHLLELYLQGLDMSTIARQLGFTSTSYVRKRKFKCKEQLISSIEGDEHFQKLRHHD